MFSNPVASYFSLMAVTLFLGGIQLLTLGVIGKYLGRVFNETKQRPLYLIENFIPPADSMHGSVIATALSNIIPMRAVGLADPALR